MAIIPITVYKIGSVFIDSDQKCRMNIDCSQVKSSLGIRTLNIPHRQSIDRVPGQAIYAPTKVQVEIIDYRNQTLYIAYDGIRIAEKCAIIADPPAVEDLFVEVEIGTPEAEALGLTVGAISFTSDLLKNRKISFFRNNTGLPGIEWTGGDGKKYTHDPESSDTIIFEPLEATEYLKFYTV